MYFCSFFLLFCCIVSTVAIIFLDFWWCFTIELFFKVFILMFFTWCGVCDFFYICSIPNYPWFCLLAFFLFFLKQVKRKIKCTNRRFSTIVWKHLSIIDTCYFVAIMWPPGQSKFILLGEDPKMIHSYWLRNKNSI